MQLPVLYTSRLRLDELTLADADDVTRMASSFAIARMTVAVPHPYPVGAAAAWISTHPVLRERGSDLVWAIRHPQRLVGVMGLHRMVAGHQAEIGYWLGEAHHGLGIATEALQAVCRWALGDGGLIRITGRHRAANPASGQVMRKAGFRHEDTLRCAHLHFGELDDTVLYGLLRDDPVAT
ncbi:GNAT family N-acetyltransferase [Uliginosibacterium sp. H1]|uniref:GNAT family N-acetyltransferase n=1 Tax=Uliginosibacterium sp. H1 TaxID=3114757 RepID=UPI002E1901CF|nr:GNAT family N-acetyltransferase [Uliginosibacterium sp. H1]